MSKVHLSIKTTFGCPKSGRIRQVSLYYYNYSYFYSIYIYVTFHAKTLHKSAKIFIEIIADFALPIFDLLSLQISYG